jgi:hypothetical protein
VSAANIDSLLIGHLPFEAVGESSHARGKSGEAWECSPSTEDLDAGGQIRSRSRVHVKAPPGADTMGRRLGRSDQKSCCPFLTFLAHSLATREALKLATIDGPKCRKKQATQPAIVVFLVNSDPITSITNQSPSKSRGFGYPYVYGAGFSRTILLMRFSYSPRSFLNRLYASACAGDSGLGSFRRSCIPRRICFTVMAGFHPSSSFKIDKHTVPDGYTFGWKSGGTNLPATKNFHQSHDHPQDSARRWIGNSHLGGFVGYSVVASRSASECMHADVGSQPPIGFTYHRGKL